MSGRCLKTIPEQPPVKFASLFVLRATLLLVLNSSPALAVPEAIGRYWKGSLKGAVNARDLFRNSLELESVSPEAYQFTTEKMLRAISELGRWVESRWPGKHRVLVGDLSLKNGGKIASHETHQNGLDADIGYLSLNPKSQGHRSNAFHNRFRETFVKDGKLLADFDLGKNFSLFLYLIETGDVGQIFVGCEIKRALMEFTPAPEERKKKDKVLGKLIAYPFHEDHFHLRLLCPGANSLCENDTRQWKDVKCKT